MLTQMGIPSYELHAKLENIVQNSIGLILIINAALRSDLNLPDIKKALPNVEKVFSLKSRLKYLNLSPASFDLCI